MPKRDSSILSPVKPNQPKMIRPPARVLPSRGPSKAVGLRNRPTNTEPSGSSDGPLKPAHQPKNAVVDQENPGGGKRAGGGGEGKGKGLGLRPSNTSTLPPPPPPASTFTVFEDSSAQNPSTSTSGEKKDKEKKKSGSGGEGWRVHDENSPAEPMEKDSPPSPQQISSSLRPASKDSGISSGNESLASVLGVPKRQPLATISGNNPFCPSVEDVVRRTGDLFSDSDASLIDDSDLSLTHKEEEEEEGDGDSMYESAASTATTEFYTAPPPSEKELHQDLIFTCPDYQDDIMFYLRQKELKVRTKKYLHKQKELTCVMRGILVDWLVDVAAEYGMSEETLHLTINYVDRFLHLIDIPKEKLQLVGTTAIMIASKYEEIYPPDTQEFVYITDDTYTRKQVLKMERVILDKLEFQMSPPTTLLFLKKYLKHARSPPTTVNMAMYLADLSLMEYDCVGQLPSVLAAACVCLANLITGADPWPLCLEDECGYTVAKILPAMTLLLTRLKLAPHSPQKAVYEKYKDPKFYEVALLPAPDTLPLTYSEELD